MGAYLSKGGKSFICCSSSYMDKKRQCEEPDRSHPDQRLHCYRSPVLRTLYRH